MRSIQCLVVCVVASCGFPQPAEFVGPPAQIALTAGNGQSASAGSTLPSRFVVTVEDINDKPIAGVAVDFIVTAGGGALSAASVVTDALGQAQISLTLGTTAGANSVEARASGLSGSPVVFSAVGTAGPAAQILITAGSGQSATAGSLLTSPFVVTVEGVYDNPVAGAAVDFVVTAGGGSVSTASIVTNAQGRAESTLTLGQVEGTNTVEARVVGLSAVAFTAIGLVGAPAQVVLESGNSQTGTAGSALAAPFVVIVEDATGNPISGFSVAFVVTTGGGNASATNVATNAQGQVLTARVLRRDLTLDGSRTLAA
jgi:hypothetical protein